MTLSVADVVIRVASRSALSPIDDPAYLPFTKGPARRAAGVSTMRVEVLSAPAPSTDAPVLFESGGVWRMRADGDGYRLELRAGAQGRHRTVVSADAGTTQVKVFVAPEGEPVGPLAGPLPNPVRYPLDQLLLMNHLATRGGVIVHAAGVAFSGLSVVFAGVSGAGKSTLARLLQESGLDDHLLSDDRVILRRPRLNHMHGGAVDAWGTPWPGDARVARNAGAPLAALVFLVHAAADELVPLDPGGAMRRLMPVVSCPWYDGARGGAILETCGRIVETIPCFALRFKPGPAVVKLLIDRFCDGLGRR